VKAAAFGEQKPAMSPPTQVQRPVEAQVSDALKFPQAISALLTWHKTFCMPEPVQFKICSYKPLPTSHPLPAPAHSQSPLDVQASSEEAFSQSPARLANALLPKKEKDATEGEQNPWLLPAPTTQAQPLKVLQVD